jgi:enamine deaminase RidA (YjgF/YER057c/UK114 family)
MRLFAILLGLVLAVSVFGQPEPKMAKKKKNEDKEPVTQSLPLLPVPPLVVSAETGRLTFQLSPLSSKGLLSQQSRDALKAMMQSNRGSAIVRVRAFVAGTGDMRRVQQIISEAFTEKKLPLPVLTTVQVGALPMVGAQVEMEAISEDRRVVNPDGVVFFPGAASTDIRAAVTQLRGAVERSGVSAAGILSVTCFASSIDDNEAARTGLASAFPGAVLNLMEAQRSPADRFALCEAAGRVEAGSAAVSGPQAVVVKSPKVVFSGIQMAFGREESDLRLAFERLQKVVGPMVGTGGVVAVRYYAMDGSLGQKLAGLGREMFHRGALAGSAVEVEGLPSLDASVGMEVIAGPGN